MKLEKNGNAYFPVAVQTYGLKWGLTPGLMTNNTWGDGLAFCSEHTAL